MGPAPAALLLPNNSVPTYTTRIRDSSRQLKHSPRLRTTPESQTVTPPSPTPRAKPVPKLPLTQPQSPVFPLPNVMLHPEDANSKVFLAIGRAFLSVENRAMTIKDLAEMTIKCGLVCQNVSAASQAITTYVRSHLNRCDTQGDYPLLIKHMLSGTASDDDLCPALYSLTGGANLQGTNQATAKPEHRKTWFRRGTMVWYLSKATGVQCPFARAGINLADYGENVSPKTKDAESKHKDGEQSGQKRKRALRGSCGDSPDAEAEEQPAKPPKVRLTLRLKPPMQPNSPCEIIDLSKDTEADRLTDNREDCTEDSGLPPYPRRSIDIPCYTPSYEGAYPSYPVSPFHSSPSSSRWRRSPSVPHSIASLGSLPPDSDDEIFTPELQFRYSYPVPSEQDSDEDDEDSLRWDSPGPHSPMTPAVPAPRIQIAESSEFGLAPNSLARWDFDSEGHLPVTDLELELSLKSGANAFAFSDWSRTLMESPDLTSAVKEEELDIEAAFEPMNEGPLTSFADSPIASAPASPVCSRSRSDSRQPSPEVVWKDVEVLGPDTVNARDFDDGAWEGYSLRERSKSNSPASSSDLVEPRDGERMTINLLTPPSSPKGFIETSLPSFPAIRATCLEGVPVYQMSLGDSFLLRRIDTNYVNISTLVDYLRVPQPLATAQVTIVTEGSSTIRGIWVPLSFAQWFAREHASGCCFVRKFLSDNLEDHFPSSLKRLGTSPSPHRQRFGSVFESTAEARRGSCCSEDGHVSNWVSEPVDEHKSTADQPDAETVKSLKEIGAYVLKPREEKPLTQQEQEIFHEFMVGYAAPKDEVIDFDEPEPLPTVSETLEAPTTLSKAEEMRPLRRSKRHAVTTTSHSNKR